MIGANRSFLCSPVCSCCSRTTQRDIVGMDSTSGLAPRRVTRCWSPCRQAELYQANEQGCRIRRETQGLYYMCCDGVRRGHLIPGAYTRPLFSST